MSKQSGKVQAKSWQPPAVQTASFGFSARPFPEIARKEEGKQASLDLLQMKENQPGGMIDNINRSLASASPPAPLPILGLLGVQAKLTLGTVGDVYEQEADRVARQVVDEIHSDPFRASNTTSEGESIAKVGEAGRVQRQITVRAAGDAGGEISSEWEGELVRAKGGGQPMSPTVREPMERAFGADFGGVRVHTGAQADMLARSIQAKAFTTGHDVFFRQGAYEPGSRGGQELIAHELTHVVQQNGGTVQRLPQEFPQQRATETTSEFASNSEVKSLQLNSESIMFWEKSSSRELSITSINQEVVQCVGKVGEAPESFEEQLSNRFSRMWQEAGLSEFDILAQKIMQAILRKGGNNRPAAITSMSHVFMEAIHASITYWVEGLHVYAGMILANAGVVAMRSHIGDITLATAYVQKKIDNTINEVVREELLSSKKRELVDAAPHLRFNIHNFNADNVINSMAQSYLARSNVDVAIPYYLNNFQMESLRTSLYQMPVVDEILKGDIATITQEKGENRVQQNKLSILWLAPDIIAEEDSEINGAIVKNINIAMGMIVNMVDPDILATLPIPKVVVHRNPTVLEAIRNGNPEDLAGFRAYSVRDTMAIHIAENEKPEVIVHEVGHQVEYFLPTAYWMKIQKLIRGRHAEAGGGNLQRISAIQWFFSSNKQEPCYRARTEPVTGWYSLKHYMGGSTEVFSMSMEFFSDRKRARELLFNDPLQAAIILEAIAPRQFEQCVNKHLWLSILKNRKYLKAVAETN